MNVSDFVAKWRQVALTERSASQQHFLDLCEVFGHEKPALADPTWRRRSRILQIRPLGKVKPFRA